MSKTLIIEEEGRKLYVLDHKSNKVSKYFLTQYKQRLTRHERYRELSESGLAHVTYYDSHDAHLVFLFRYLEDDIALELRDKLNVVHIVKGQPFISPKEGKEYTIVVVSQETIFGEEFGINKTTKLTLALTTSVILG